MTPMARGRLPRPRRRSLPALLFILIALATGLLACSRTPVARTASHRDLTIGVALPRGDERLGLNNLVGGLSVESLVSLAQDGRPEPRLAASWKRSPDGLTWTFSLAPDIYFQDGRRATAPLVATMLQAAASDPRNRAVRPNLAEIASITAPDDATIAVRTRVPRVLLIDQLSDLSIPPTPANGALGAFVRDSGKGDELSFRAFDQYYRGRPGVERITYRSYRSLRAAWAAMLRGETDAIYEVGRDSGEFVQAESGVRVYPLVRPFAASVFFNVQRPALRPIAVRRALSAMIDRAEIVRSAYRGSGTIANGPLWPFHWALAGHQAQSPAPQPDLPGVVRSPGRPPARLRFTCLVLPNVVPFERVALIIQRQLYDHGVDMQLEAVTLEQLQQRLRTGDFDAVLFEFIGRTPNWMYSFWHSPAPNQPALLNTGYRAADEPLDRLLASENEDQVRSAIADVYRAMEADPPAVFIVWPQVSRAMSRDFETPLGEGRDVLAASSLWMVRPAGAGARR